MIPAPQTAFRRWDTVPAGYDLTILYKGRAEARTERKA